MAQCEFGWIGGEGSGVGQNSPESTMFDDLIKHEENQVNIQHQPNFICHLVLQKV